MTIAAPPITPTPTSPPRAAARPEPSNAQLFRRMLTFIRPVRGVAGAAGAMVIVWMIIDVLSVRMTGNVINAIQSADAAHTLTNEPFSQAVHHDPLRSILYLVVILGLLVLLNAFVRFIREFVNSKFAMDIVYHMRARVYDQLQRVGFSFHDEHSSGALINRALSDLQNVRAFLQMGVVLSVEIIAFAGGSFLLIANISRWIALAALVPVPFWIWYILRFSKRVQPAQLTQMTAGDELLTVFTENIAGVHVVKAFATEKTEMAKYDRAADTYFDRIMDTVKLWRNFIPMVRGIAGGANLALIAIGACLVVATRGTSVRLGDLLVVGTAMGTILARLQQINQITEQYQKAITSSRRFFEVLDAPPRIKEPANAPALPPGPGAVQFQSVTFGYDPLKPVVKDISFYVPGGSVVALVGPTGAGKTTLVQLLARFYDPQSGAIAIDNTNTTSVNLSSLRNAVGFVFQETFLFSDTVANNIRYKNPEASLGSVEAAARIAQAHEFINELPQGYDTMLGERGATLSGGQRQRLAIARAILANPRILVLDDALAAVDPETEHQISRALELVMVDRTVFIIAHRLSTVKAADLVLVLENGRITQQGTRKELMRQPGHYRHIAEVQLAYDETEAKAKAEKNETIAAQKT